MWGMLPVFNTIAVYRPTANTGSLVTGGSMVNETYAYDVDSEPWATCARLTQANGNPGTAQESSWLYTYGTSIANANPVILRIVYDFTLNWPTNLADSTKCVYSGVAIDYSSDGGTNYNSITLGGYLPAQINLGYAQVFSVAKQTLYISLPAIANLNLIRVKARANSLYSGTEFSTATLQIYDIQAQVTL